MSMAPKLWKNPAMLPRPFSSLQPRDKGQGIRIFLFYVSDSFEGMKSPRNRATECLVQKIGSSRSGQTEWDTFLLINTHIHNVKLSGRIAYSLSTVMWLLRLSQVFSGLACWPDQKLEELPIRRFGHYRVGS